MTFEINKVLNKFVFIGELCGLRDTPWSKERSISWTKKSGGRLSDKEEILKKCFIDIFADCNFNLVEAYFVANKGESLWKALAREVGAVKAEALESVLKGFTKRFEVLWVQEEQGLKDIARFFKIESKKINSALEMIAKLTNLRTGQFSSDIIVQLVMSSGKKDDVMGWFSILNKKADLVLECSPNKNKDYSFLESVLFHEFFHLAIRKKPSLKKLIEDISEKNKKDLCFMSDGMPPFVALEELFVSSFVPEGILASRYFNKKIKSINSIKRGDGSVSFVCARQFFAYALRELSGFYIDNNKALDEKYLLSLIEEIKKTVRKVRTAE
jgi:hypothetical protein